MIEAGELGQIRVVQVEYAQDWLAEPIEKQRPEQAGRLAHGPGVGGAGRLFRRYRHACVISFAAFVTRHDARRRFPRSCIRSVPGRRIDDHVQAMLRYANGARAACCGRARSRAARRTHCVCVSTERKRASHSIRAAQRIVVHAARRSSAAFDARPRERRDDAAHATRVPAGHPEGYLEAFAQLYKDAALQIEALNEGRALPPESLC